MISSLHIAKHNAYEGGFRYTHDVLWRGAIVGEATGVRPASHEAFTWYAYVRYRSSIQSFRAVASDDTQPTTIFFAAILERPSRDQDPDTITAQTVYLRGTDKNGSYELRLKPQPVLISGVHPPANEHELAEMQQDHPEILIW